ncbi:MAG: ParB/RepB/Spo0J family partition protein [Patescibacteria group bacterium]|jgi:ParB family chromosome partitioning protein
MTLGRGLDSLIPKKVIATPTAPLPDKPDETIGGERILQIPIEKIAVNPHQPRKEFGHGALEDLINSVKEHGILQPLIVTKQNDGYELIAGERRFRAAKTLEFKTVPAIVRQASEAEKLEIAIIENIQRKDLNLLEEAAGYQRLIDEFSLTQEDVAKKVGKSRAVVANTLRLLDLPEAVQLAISDGKISASHARVLAGVDDKHEQENLFKKIISDELNVREAEHEAQRVSPPTKKSARSITLPDASVLAQEEELRKRLGTKVKIEKKDGKGKIIVEFFSEEELNDLIDKMGRFVV